MFTRPATVQFWQTGIAAVWILIFLSASRADQQITLAGFQALLFNSRTGTFSTDILGKNRLELGNVPIGEFASVSTFVTVKVNVGRGAPVPKTLRLRLVATESGSMPFAAAQTERRDRVILDQTAVLGPVNADGLTHTGFWLSNTGCHSIALKASLVGIPASRPITEVLPFVCYE